MSDYMTGNSQGLSDAGERQARRHNSWLIELHHAVEEFLDTMPAMPQARYVVGKYTWTADQYKALIKLNNTFHTRS